MKIEDLRKQNLTSTICNGIQRTNDWLVSLESDGNVWECGKTLEDAVDKMKVRANVDILVLYV